MAIYVLCPDHNDPSGGVKKLYRHVDVLNQHGWNASILHQTPGFRCRWFEHDTRISYAPATTVHPTDYLVVPEIYGPVISQIQPGIPKVIFNQNCYLTSWGYSLAKKTTVAAYRHPDVVATLVVSEDSESYLRYVFPGVRVHRLHYGIAPDIFYYWPDKKRQIAFMPRKNREDVRQVLNALDARDALRNYGLAPIDGQTERETARVLRESLLFLSVSREEGFGLPPAEAMACGCIVVGFHGMGGREYFDPGHCYAVPEGDILTFIKTVEQVMATAESNPGLLRAQGKKAASFIAEHYSLEREEADIVQFWSSVTDCG